MNRRKGSFLGQFPLFILLTASLLRLVNLGSQSLWFDETATWLRATLPLPQALEFSRANFVHPPLYYVLLRLSGFAREGEFMLRFPSALFGILEIAVLYILTKKIYGQETGLVAAALLAVNPFHIWYSQEAKMYTLVFLESTFIGFFTYEVFKSNGKRGWNGLVISSMAAYLTHYFSFLLALAQYIFILLNFKRLYRLLRRWTLSQFIAAIPVGLWGFFVLLAPEKRLGIGWIPGATLADLFLTLCNFSVSLPGRLDVYSVLGFTPFGIALAWAVYRSEERAWWVTWLFSPLVFVLVLTLATRRNFYVDRFFFVCLPAYLLLVAWGAANLPGARLRMAVISLMFLASIAGIARMRLNDLFTKDDWRGVCAFIREEFKDHDTVVVDKIEWIVPLRYYGCRMPVEELASWKWGQARPGGRVWIVYRNPYEWAHTPARPRHFNVLSEGMIYLGENKVKGHFHFTGIEVLLVTPFAQRF